ncbi:hypothetical protein KJZ63_03220 [Patescibacteria group bacterium]|nr:hypothetical protein [Patescibacteria group bacterium]
MVEQRDQPLPTEPQPQTVDQYGLEKKIIQRRDNDLGHDENVALTNGHYEIIKQTGIELDRGEEWEHTTRLEILKGHVDSAFIGNLSGDFWDPPIPEVREELTAEFPPNTPFQVLEENHYRTVKVIGEIFEQRFSTIRLHLVEQLTQTLPNKNSHLGLKALVFEANDDFFIKVEEYLKAQSGVNYPTEEQSGQIAEHWTEFQKQERLYKRKQKKLTSHFSQVITNASKETINQIHKDFLAGLQDAINEFADQEGQISGPIVAILKEFRKQAEVAPGEEILKAVRKMYLLTTFDKDNAGAVFLTSFTLSRALVLGVIKNYWESSGNSIIEFQNKLKTWWVSHVNRPKVLENGKVHQEIISPMLNSERGSYFTMFSLEDEKLENLRRADQIDAIGILARQQLLSTLVDQERNQGLDILDGWTHTDMPHQSEYAIVVQFGDVFKKFIFKNQQLQNIEDFLSEFNQQFDSSENWYNYQVTPKHIGRAMSGKHSIQEAEKTKFDPTDPTSADTSVVLLAEDDTVMAEDVIQRGAKSWTHGAAIKFSLTLFVDKNGQLTGRGAQKGAHAWTDGRVSTIKLENTLVEASTLLTINAATNKNNRTIDTSILTNGSEFIYEEQEAPLQIAQFERKKYQERIQKLFEFFKNLQPPEARFTLDINGIISGAVMVALNDIWKVSKKGGHINNIQFLERAKFVRSGVQIGDSLTPVPLQFNDKMQEQMRKLSAMFEARQNGSDTGENEKLSSAQVKKMLQRLVLSFALFDEERRTVRDGKPGIIAVMAEMVGKLRKPLTFISGITSKELTDMAINTVLISSLVPSRPRPLSSDTDINIESFSTAMDEVYKNFGFVIATSSFGQGENEKISIVVRQMNETIAPVLEKYSQVLGEPVTLQSMVEKNMDRILMILEAFKDEYEKESEQKNG